MTLTWAALVVLLQELLEISTASLSQVCSVGNDDNPYDTSMVGQLMYDSPPDADASSISGWTNQVCGTVASAMHIEPGNPVMHEASTGMVALSVVVMLT